MSARRRSPPPATRTDWTDWRGTGRDWRRGRRRRCTSKSCTTTDPWTRRRRVSASPASWSWCWYRGSWTASRSRWLVRASTRSSAERWRCPPPSVFTDKDRHHSYWQRIFNLVYDVINSMTSGYLSALLMFLYEWEQSTCCQRFLVLRFKTRP